MKEKTKRGNLFSRFSNITEATASELPENQESRRHNSSVLWHFSIKVCSNRERVKQICLIVELNDETESIT